MAKASKNITHDSPDAELLEDPAAYHHTGDGHYKYYYMYLFKYNNSVYIQKKWGRIGNAKGSTTTDVYPVTSTRSYAYQLSIAKIDLSRAERSKKDKGYKKVNLDKIKLPDAPAEKVFGLSRFRDI